MTSPPETPARLTVSGRPAISAAHGQTLTFAGGLVIAVPADIQLRHDPKEAAPPVFVEAALRNGRWTATTLWYASPPSSSAPIQGRPGTGARSPLVASAPLGRGARPSVAHPFGPPPGAAPRPALPGGQPRAQPLGSPPVGSLPGALSTTLTAGAQPAEPVKRRGGLGLPQPAPPPPPRPNVPMGVPGPGGVVPFSYDSDLPIDDVPF